MPQKMVVWVRFPHLPLHLYHGQVLNSLGNLIGKTVKIDFNTQKAERGKFARIAIEIDLNDPLPPVINLDGAFQKIECENLPTLCFDSAPAPTPESFGPWMLVSRNFKRPKKEGLPPKETAKSKVAANQASLGVVSRNKESMIGGKSLKIPLASRFHRKTVRKRKIRAITLMVRLLLSPWYPLTAHLVLLGIGPLPHPQPLNPTTSLSPLLRGKPTN
ncbi:hypothetical protein LINPERHAP1_LOCUS34552 [Linum perenne]